MNTDIEMAKSKAQEMLESKDWFAFIGMEAWAVNRKAGRLEYGTIIGMVHSSPDPYNHSTVVQLRVDGGLMTEGVLKVDFDDVFWNPDEAINAKIDKPKLDDGMTDVQKAFHGFANDVTVIYNECVNDGADLRQFFDEIVKAIRAVSE